MLVCGNSICCNTEVSIFPEYVSNRVCGTHAHVTVKVANPVLPFRLRNMSRKMKESLRSLKNVSFLDSVLNKDGERLDMLYLLVCIIGTSYSLVTRLMWVFIICKICNFLFTCFPSHQVFIFTYMLSVHLSAFLCITQGATYLQ